MIGLILARRYVCWEGRRDGRQWEGREEEIKEGRGGDEEGGSRAWRKREEIGGD